MKRKRKHIDFIELAYPDDSIMFFEDLKLKSEQYWSERDINPRVYGFQIQKETKWQKGLSTAELEEFEKQLGFTFPLALRNYYQTMNGTDKLAINVYGNNGDAYAYSSSLYAYPRDLEQIQGLIEWIYTENQITPGELHQRGISRIMPVFAHRFMLIDVPGNPILSMYGNDILYWADNLSKLLANELVDNIYNISPYENNPGDHPHIEFWFDERR